MIAYPPFQLNDARAVLLVTTAAFLDRARETVARLAHAVDIVSIDPADSVPTLKTLAVDDDPPAVAIDPARDVVVMPYSSGTTGLPKGVLLTHRNLIANLAQIDAIEAPDLQAFLVVLPLFHIYGMVVIMNFGLMRRATLVTLPRFNLETVLRLLQQWPISLVPSLAFIDQIPKSASGKILRRVLVAAESERRAAASWRTPRLISFGSTAANPRINPDGCSRPRQ
jgi:acyl-CoA synthetase (AMP-forming)/AMP-acid ligase II